VSETLNTVILGIVEGVTEFLPVSSTGHLLIVEQFLGERSEMFNVAIQSGAILAIVLIYYRRITQMLLHTRQPENRDYLYKLTVSVLITLVLGFVAKHLGFQLPATVLPIAIATLVGGVAILAIESYVAGKPKATEVTWSAAVWVGLAQIAAGLLPGTSRSAATIFAAMLAGVTFRPAATEFAFLVGIPTLFAATAYELLKARHEAASADWSGLVLAFVVAACISRTTTSIVSNTCPGYRLLAPVWKLT